MENNVKQTPAFFKPLAIVEAVIIVVLACMLFSTNNQNNKLEVEVEQNVMQKDSLKGELAGMIENYNNLKTNNDTLNAKLEEQKAKVAQLMEDLDKTKASNRAQIAQYKKEVETLRKIMRSFVVQIDSLNTKNQQLLAENAEIRKDISNQKAENRQLNNLKDSLQGRVKEAELLKARKFTIIGLNDRGAQTNRINKTSKFQIDFYLEENFMTPKGTKELFVRLVKPDGAIIVNPDTKYFSYEGKEIASSASKNVDFDGNQQAVTIFVACQEVLASGQYKAVIYQGGKAIGQSTVNMN